MTLVVLELKQAEVDFLNNLGRCKLCDHLGAFHHEAHEEYDGDVEHCGTCIIDNAGGECDGINMAIILPSRCMIDSCMCEDFR